MSLQGSCSLGYPQCRVEFALTLPQINQAYKMAERFSKKNSPFGFPLYPYVFTPTQEHDTIRMDMGHDDSGKLVVAVFTIKIVPNRPGALAHVAIFKIDVEAAKKTELDEGWTAVFTIDIHYHTEAMKHFRGQLLRMDLGPSNGYLVNVPGLPPAPEPEDELPPPQDFEDLL